jgi:arylsulfatase A-like enzyme
MGRWFPRTAGVIVRAALCAGVLTGCDRGERPNLLLITVDTMRRDVLRTYGGSEVVFPNPVAPYLDQLAAESVVIDSCYTVSPRTTQSMATLFTGLYPSRHGAFGIFHLLPPAANTLAEILAAEGYRTGAVVTNHFLQAGRGFEQGFQGYDDQVFRSRQEYAQNVVDRVDLMTLERPSEPFFYWVHFLDPHWPYDAPDQAVKLFDPAYEGPFTVFADVDSQKVTRGEIIFQNTLDREVRRHVQASYLAEVRYMDDQLRRMMIMLKNRGFLENTIVVVTSDHGESMGEHDYFYAHGETLYQGTVMIPAFIHFPKKLDAGRVGGIVSNADLAPTILDLLRIEPPAGLDGTSIAGEVRSRRRSPRTSAPMESDYQLIYPENPRFHIQGPKGKWRAVVSNGFKLIRIPNPAANEHELYDLTYDVLERRNVYDAMPEKVAEMAPLLDAWSTEVDAQEAAIAVPDSATQARLRSLGYVN